METLRNMKNRVEEDKLFTIIENLNINKKDYMAEIERQTWGQKKTQIFQSLYLE